MNIFQLIPDFEDLEKEYIDKSVEALFLTRKVLNQRVYSLINEKSFSLFYQHIDRISVIDYLLQRRPRKEIKDYIEELKEGLESGTELRSEEQIYLDVIRLGQYILIK